MGSRQRQWVSRQGECIHLAMRIKKSVKVLTYSLCDNILIVHFSCLSSIVQIPALSSSVLWLII